MAPASSEVYLDDERKGSVGSSGRVVLTNIPAGQHILRVSKTGEKDDERVIEIREGVNEQVIQAHLRTINQEGSQPSSGSQGSSSGAQSSMMPGIVACSNCNARFAEGVKFCGRCGNRSFILVVPAEDPGSFPCPRCSNMLPPNSKFCGRCGLNMVPAATDPRLHSQATFLKPNLNMPVPQQAERLCGKCGESFPVRIKFCGRCGNVLGP